MDTYTISSWAELSDLAQQFSTRNRVFRGVEDESYDLIPKIGRCGTRKKLDGTDLVYSPDAEGKCIARFKREARPHLMLEPRSELEWLCIAQHHGLPTRLLDWSASPLVAAFFAVKPTGIVRGERKDPAIYALPPRPSLSQTWNCRPLPKRLLPTFRITLRHESRLKEVCLPGIAPPMVHTNRRRSVNGLFQVACALV